jgi:hypothetical protein
MSDTWRRRLFVVAVVAGIIAFLWWWRDIAKDGGYADGQSAVYSDQSDLWALATTEMCDRLERYDLEELGAETGDPGLVDEAVNLVLYAGQPTHMRTHADDYEDYPDDIGEDGSGAAGIVLEATVMRCPRYLPVVAEAVEEFNEYQSEPIPGPAFP